MNDKGRCNRVVIPLLAAVFGLSSCSGTQGRSGPPDPVGDYTLVSVNGEAVPAEVSEQGMVLRILSGAVSFGADGTCSSRTVFQPPSQGEVTREVAATYEMEGDTLTLRWEGAGTTKGILHGDTFTMDNVGMTFVYERQR